METPLELRNNSGQDVIEIYVQGEKLPDIHMIRVPQGSNVRAIAEQAIAHGLPAVTDGHDVAILLEDGCELNPDMPVDHIDHGHKHFHCHRCRSIEVSVTFKGVTKTLSFLPSATIKAVKVWSDKAFELQPIDAAELSLAVCGCVDRPGPDVHIGRLVEFPHCKVCFDLSPKKRIEG